MGLFPGWGAALCCTPPARALSNDMDEAGDGRSGDNPRRIGISMRRGPIVVFDNDCTVAVHLRDVNYVTQIPAPETLGA